MRPAAPLPDRLLATARAQEGLLSARQCDDGGVGSARRAALREAGLLRPVVRGVHDAAAALVQTRAARAGGWGSADPADRDRRRSAWLAVLALGPEKAVAVGSCALALYGVQGLPPRIRPEASLLDGSDRSPGGGIRVRCTAPKDVQRIGTILVTGPVTALAQAVCELPRDRAVAVLDSAVQTRLLRADQVEDVRRAVLGRRGSRRTAGWWGLVDGRAQSPLETVARLQCVDAGVPPHDLQVPVLDAAGRAFAFADLGWWLADGRLLAAEIDGAGPHGAPEALFRDRERQNRVVATGAVVLRFTAQDIRAGRVAGTIAAHTRPSRLTRPG
ncbi:hypothetical protein [Cellulomonas sp. S1-8]|uniref:hypothetical protein n=1 Tax=Cellulomonas sp. S1-8 TaxID=2904790 RepID=UPI002243B329|nr:hypothetical protein [Cellulomonas sp. S1-8]UZN03963.1 hypothetical protein OKX07_03205 [Cellulomonas sp. S1-8]